MHARSGGQLQPASPIAHESVNGVGKGTRIVARYQQAAHAIGDGSDQTTDRCSDDRGTARLSLDSHEAERLRM